MIFYLKLKRIYLKKQEIYWSTTCCTGLGMITQIGMIELSLFLFNLVPRGCYTYKKPSNPGRQAIQR